MRHIGEDELRVCLCDLEAICVLLAQRETEDLFPNYHGPIHPASHNDWDGVAPLLFGVQEESVGVERHLEVVGEVTQLPEFACPVENGEAAAYKDEEAVWNSRFLCSNKCWLLVSCLQLSNLEHFLFLVFLLLNLSLLCALDDSTCLNFLLLFLGRLSWLT